MNNMQFTRRILVVVVILALLMTVLCSNLYTLQYTNGAEYAAQSVTRIAETQTVAASRGLILDRNGTVLVSNKSSYQVSLNTSQMGKDNEERCANLLALIQISREEGVEWADTLPISKEAPFTFTTENPYYTTGTDEEGNETKTLTRLGSLAVKMKWIEDPTQEPEETEPAEPEEPSLWEKFLIAVGLREEPQEEEPEEPYRLPTAEELLGMMCRDFGVKGQGAVDEKAAKAAGEEVPVLNIGDMSSTDARAVAGVLFELYYRSRVSNWPLYVYAQDVSTDFITRVKEEGIQGVEIETVSVRQYNTTYAAHLLGRVASMDASEAEYYLGLDAGYTLNDKVGKEGVESAFESYLRGVPGVRTVERNEEGKIVSSTWLTDPETGESQEPEPGGNVFLTIDIELQKMVEDTLAGGLGNLKSDEVEGAACVVLDVDSGDILAAASYPTFSLETYAEDFAENSTDPLEPLYNRAFMEIYPPGSTFKMITSIAGLEEGIITPTSEINTLGIYTYWPDWPAMCWYYRQYGGHHGYINVTEAIEVSCNYFFFDVGRRLGIEVLDEYASRFGLGQKTGVELPESTGHIAGPEYSKSIGMTWYEGNILSAAIGQENTMVTPIQLANYVATLVNGGTRYSTHLLKSVKSSDFSQVEYVYEPQVLSTIDIKEENLTAVKEGMKRVVDTSSAFRNLPVEAGGKTGSAQISAATQSNAVFVAFAPYDDPQIAIAMVVEHGGSGGTLTTMVSQILTYYFTPEENQGQLPLENVLIP